MPWGIAAAAIIGGVLENRAIDKAGKREDRAAKRSIEATQAASRQARSDVLGFGKRGAKTANRGFQGALDVFGQAIPAQLDVFQQGNLGAQQALLAGLPQMRNAILGGNVDFGALQPFQVQNVPTGLFQQQTPLNILIQESEVIAEESKKRREIEDLMHQQELISGNARFRTDSRGAPVQVNASGQPIDGSRSLTPERLNTGFNFQQRFR